MNFDYTSEFKKELKAFAKKWRSLPSDLGVFEKVATTLYVEQEGVDLLELRKAFFNNKRATILQVISDTSEVVKTRLDCASLGSQDILRLTYIQNGDRILFVELYAKNVKSREDDRRIKEYL